MSAGAPLASVVMPLYNKAPFVLASVRSVLDQTMGDFELVVSDDGSADGGADLVEGLGDPRIRIARFPNGGASEARNRGAALARGELVAFLDADDLWEPRFLESLVDALESRPRAIAAFCAFGEGADGRCRMPRPDGVTLIEDYPGWFIRTRGRGMWCSNTLVRRVALEAAGPFPRGVQNGEDTDTWFRVSFRGPVAYVPEILCRYVVDDAASLSKVHAATEPMVIGTIEKALERGGVPPAARASAFAAVDYFRVAYASALAMEGRRAEALRQALRARPRPRLWRTYARAAFALVTGR